MQWTSSFCHWLFLQVCFFNSKRTRYVTYHNLNQELSELSLVYGWFRCSTNGTRTQCFARNIDANKFWQGFLAFWTDLKCFFAVTLHMAHWSASCVLQLLHNTAAALVYAATGLHLGPLAQYGKWARWQQYERVVTLRNVCPTKYFGEMIWRRSFEQNKLVADRFMLTDWRNDAFCCWEIWTISFISQHPAC